MHVRIAKRLLDIAMAVICLWAAAYHTPAGALLRSAYASLTHGHSSAPPLLAFYNGGEPEVAQTWASLPPPPPPALIPPGVSSSRLALGYGVHASLLRLDPAQREPARAVASKYGVAAAALEDPSSGPREVAKVLDALAASFPSEDAAVLALLCGEVPARYAQDRARAEGKGADWDAIGRALPPRYEAQVRQAGQALALGVAYGLTWPVSETAAISSPFGSRRDPINGQARMHTGVDIPLPEGTAVHATAPGLVRRASEDALNGRVLIIDHGHGVTTAYCHNSRLEVSAGARVERGQEISLSGNTGRSTGPHLHYQLAFGGTPVDPLRYRAAMATTSATGGEP